VIAHAFRLTLRLQRATSKLNAALNGTGGELRIVIWLAQIGFDSFAVDFGTVESFAAAEQFAYCGVVKARSASSVMHVSTLPSAVYVDI
jgi:hypothetical protein